MCLSGAYAIVGGAGNSSPPFFSKEAIVDDNTVDNLSEELLKEFTSMGNDYPYMVKLLVDMVSIVSQQNAQLEAIANHLETITMEVNKQHFALDDLLQESEGWVSRARKPDTRPFEYIAPFRGPKKEDFN